MKYVSIFNCYIWVNFLTLFYRTDTQAEWDLVKKASLKAGAFNAVICSHWAKGGVVQKLRMDRNVSSISCKAVPRCLSGNELSLCFIYFT